ncbi:hypothetical protein [Chryseobacterium indoltheticum]
MGLLIAPFISAKTLKLSDVGKAMINAVAKGYSTQILETEDILKLAK